MQGLNPATMQCTYSTPCGWCAKWDKKCDKKIDKPHKDIVLEELFDITQSFAKCSNPRIKKIKEGGNCNDEIKCRKYNKCK